MVTSVSDFEKQRFIELFSQVFHAAFPPQDFAGKREDEDVWNTMKKDFLAVVENVYDQILHSELAKEVWDRTNFVDRAMFLMAGLREEYLGSEGFGEDLESEGAFELGVLMEEIQDAFDERLEIIRRESEQNRDGLRKEWKPANIDKF